MSKSTRFKYVVHDRLIVDRPLPMINKVKDIYFSLGENFDQYNFKRRSVDQKQVDLAIEQRVHSLRQQHDYLRLWFSGGRDSRFILDCFMKYEIKIDEIVVVRRTNKNNNLGMYSEFDPLLEIESSAIDFLNRNKHLLRDTKITIFDIDDEHHELLYERTDWYTWVSEWFFSVTYLPKVFHKFINPRFNLLDVSGPTCELVGSAIPTVYFGDQNNYFGFKNPNKKWNFHFSCASFNTVGADIGHIHFEDFLITDQNPELLELHVNSIVDDYERTGEHPDYSNHYRHQERLLRDRSLFFKSFPYNEFQQAKVKINLNDSEFPSDHYFWRMAPSGRIHYEMINRWYQTPMARSLKLYIENTNWNLVEAHNKNPFNTKIWTLE